MYSIAVVLTRVRHIIRERERQTVWLRELQTDASNATEAAA